MKARRPRDPSSLLSDHRRQWRDFLYVYPVLSRRSRGLSVGVNLNRDQRCTFSCVYCQVDRRTGGSHEPVDLAVLREELRAMLREALSGRLWHDERFSAAPPAMRRLNDIAFSGDGEPTCREDFDRAVAAAADVRRELGLEDVKLVVLTNASALDSPQVRRALPLLDANRGEIWAKLDAGTEERFRLVNRPPPGVTLERIVSNIAAVAKDRPVVIQTLLLRLDGEPPQPEEVDAYCRRLTDILSAGGRIRLVQLHTIARPPTCASAAMLPEVELRAVADRVRAALGPGVPVEVYPGLDVPPQPPAK